MRKIAALAEAHYVTVAPHNPMGPLATAVNLHFSAAQPNFRILEYRLPQARATFCRAAARAAPNRPTARGAWYVKDPYLPKDGYLELRPDRPGWGVEIDEEVLARTITSTGSARFRSGPDGSSGYACGAMPRHDRAQEDLMTNLNGRNSRSPGHREISAGGGRDASPVRRNVLLLDRSAKLAE